VRIPICLIRTLLAAIMLVAMQPTSTRAQPKPQLSIERPAPGQTVAKIFDFTASTRQPTAIATVEFRIGSKRLGIANSKSARVAWNTGYASDGVYQLQVIGRNADGQELSTAERLFTIDNNGNSLNVVSPDLSPPLSGVVNLSIHGTDKQYYPAIWIVSIDGSDVRHIWTDNEGKNALTVQAAVDTTAFSNGPHELYIGTFSDFWKTEPSKRSYQNWRSGFNRVVTFENGHTLMEIAANYLHIYLQPGHQTTLKCRRLFTDNKAEPCTSAVYSSSDPTMIMVSPNGTMTAGRKEGFGVVTIMESGKTTNAYVWVRKSLSVPHFSGDGRFLPSYTPGQSLFVIAPFALTARSLEVNARLLSSIKQSGVNTISQGFFSNPRNVKAGYLNWVRSYNDSFARDWAFAKQHGLHILATGDEVCRNIGGEAWWTLNWPWGKSAVQYAAASLARSGVAVGVDMVDEASAMWGATPRPPGRVGAPGSFTSISCSNGRCRVLWPNNPVNPSRFPSGASFASAGSRTPSLNTPPGTMFKATDITSSSFDFTAAGPVNGNFSRKNDPNLEFVWWAGDISGCPSQPCNPPVPNDALIQISGWMHSVYPGVPISWPALGMSPTAVQANWMGKKGISDYASHYWIPLRDRHTYTWSQGIQELGYGMAQAFYQRQPFMMLNRPQLLLTSLSGPDYTKNTSGSAYYKPPGDTLNQPGVSGAVVISEMMTAAALGAAGLRPYGFEDPASDVRRVSAPAGSSFQTGANPFSTNPLVRENWRAMSYAARMLTQVMAPYLFGVALNSPAYGQGIVTAARQGRDGRMLMIVNDNDWDRTLTADFRPYTSGHGIRYRVTPDGINTTSRIHGAGETLTLRPGEAAVYLFPNK
jgi:hypothetical protein